MDGIGEKLVEQLLDANLITSISGLYDLKARGTNQPRKDG